MKSRFDVLKDGLRIHSFVAGDSNNPPLILLHGYPTNALIWRKCLPELSKHFRVYAPDLPGFGQSDKPLSEKYDMQFYNNFLDNYYDVLNIVKANLMIHDFGGMIGLKYCSNHQNKVNKLIVLDTLPYTELPDGMLQFYNIVRSKIFSKILLMKPVFTKALFHDKKIVYNKDKIEKDIISEYHKQWVFDKNSKKAFSKVLSAPVTDFTEPRSHLSNIKSPVLILWAENDGAIGVDVAKKLVKDIPGSKLEYIYKCGHYLPEEQPEEIVKYTIKYLKS